MVKFLGGNVARLRESGAEASLGGEAIADNFRQQSDSSWREQGELATHGTV